jgi:hypothetical protein
MDTKEKEKMSQKQRSKDLKRSQKKKTHENYLKWLFNKYGHGLLLNSNREAAGNKYWTEINAKKALNE